MKNKKLIFNLLGLTVLAALILGLCLAPGEAEEGYSPAVYATILSLCPR